MAKKQLENCPITQLPIYEEDTWQNLPVGSKLTCSYKFIGDAIVYIKVEGEFSTLNVVKFNTIREEIFANTPITNQGVWIVVDASLFITGLSQTIKSFLQYDFFIDHPQIKGIIFQNLQRSLKNSLHLALVVFKTNYPILFSSTYEESMMQIQEEIYKIDRSFPNNSYQVQTNKHWQIKQKDFSAVLKIVDNYIIYIKLTGFLKEEHVTEFIACYKATLQHPNLRKAIYILFDYSEAEGVSWKARWQLSQALKQLYTELAIEPVLHFFYAPNWHSSISMSLIRYLLDKPILLVPTFEKALSIIEHAEKQTLFQELDDHSLQFGGTYLSEGELQQYNSELLDFIGSIAWEVPLSNIKKYPDNHPFHKVFNALSIIKTDIDALFEERERHQEKLDYRIQFEQIMLSISSDLLGCTFTMQQDVLYSVLKRIGEFLILERGFIGLRINESSPIRYIQFWMENGFELDWEKNGILFPDAFTWFHDQINQGKTVSISRKSDLPEAAEAESEYMKRNHIKSMILVPILYVDDLVGVLGFEASRIQRIWSEDTINLLGLMGKMISNLFIRLKTEEQLIQSHELLEQRVDERTQDLARSNEKLQEEITERQKTEKELKQTSTLYFKFSQSEILKTFESARLTTFLIPSYVH